MLTAVFLHGHLGEKYGNKLMLDVSSVAEAINLLKANFGSFARDVIGRSYRVWVGKTNIDRSELINPAKGQDIHIVPVLAGAGGNNNVLKIIVGIVLIVVSVLLDGADGGYLMNMGIGLIIGGAVGMVFSSTPRSLKMSMTEPSSSGQMPSYMFNGAVNTVGQGNPVPVLYGRMMVGSQVISGSIGAENL